MSNPDQIEMKAAQSRESLGRHMNRLSERVSPASFLERRKAKLQEGSAGLKDKLMGSADTPGQAAKEKAGSAVSSVKDATDSLGAKVSGAVSTDAVRQQTQGNPIAAGLIAFGAGWLLSSLIPVSAAEQSAAKQVEDTVGDPLKQSAQQVAASLQQPLQDAAGAVRDTAADAAKHTTEHAKSAATDVKGTAHAQAQK